MKHLKVALVAGGTAGHINPALALADTLTPHGHEVVFYGQKDKLEGELVPAHGYTFIPIVARPFVRSRPWTLLPALFDIKRSQAQLEARFRKQPPDVCMGFGAYIELPVLMAAHQCAIPYIIHEQNSVVGLANTVMAKKAAAIAVAFPAARKYFANKLGMSGTERPETQKPQLAVTGNPVGFSREKLDVKAARKRFGLTAKSKVVLVFGGSLGAASINDALISMKDKLLIDPNVHVIHVSGERDYERVRTQLELSTQDAKRYHLYPYLNPLNDALAVANVVVCRAGAASIAEISEAQIPAILIPYPHATGRHQDINAQSLSEQGSAYVLDDAMLKCNALQDMLLALLKDTSQQQRMRQAYKKAGTISAAELLASLVEQIG